MRISSYTKQKPSSNSTTTSTSNDDDQDNAVIDITPYPPGEDDGTLPNEGTDNPEDNSGNGSTHPPVDPEKASEPTIPDD